MSFIEKQRRAMAAVALVLVFALVLTLAPKNTTDSNNETAETASVEKDGLAGVSRLAENLTVDETAAVETVEASAVSETEEDADQEVVAEADQEEEVSEWDNLLVVKVNTTLNVRKKASKSSKIVGKMLTGTIATVISKSESGNWVKIESGNVKGYVKCEYCLFGEDAEKYAKKHGGYKAVATTDGLRVRKEASTDGEILTVVDKGSKFSVNYSADEVEGWVAIKYDGETAYISADYCEIKLSMPKAYTNKEYKEYLAEQEAAEASADGSSSSSSSTTKKSKSSVSSDVDDTTLLAALIACETGGSYEAKLAVASVVCNRVRSSKYPNTVRKVIYQSCQFGPASSGKLEQYIKNKSYDSEDVRAAEDALSGTDNVDGALHFKSKSSGHSGVVIGGNVFY